MPDGLVGEGPGAARTDSCFRNVASVPIGAACVTPPASPMRSGRRGELIDRVQIPPTLSVVGFGPGSVYLTSREGAGIVLLRARIR